MLSTTTSKRRKIAWALPLVAATVLAGIVVPATPASAATVREKIVSLATAQLGGTACDPGYLNSCGMDWCAEFARWAWKDAGVAYLSKLNGKADSFRTHGLPGRFHSRASGYRPQPGDAILFDWDLGADSDPRPTEHVAIVTSVSGGKVHTIGGNQDGTSWQNSRVSRASYALSHLNIYGYTAPLISGEASSDHREPDIDGNGFADMVAVTTDSDLRWYGNNGNGGFYAHKALGKAGFKQMAVGDIDGDDRADLLAVTNGDDLQWYPNNHGGGLYSHRPLGKAGFAHMALGDMDNNGLADLIAVTNDGDLRWYPNNGDENNEGFFSHRSLGPAGFKQMAVGDIDRNGFADLLAVTNDDDLRWYPNNGRGGFYSHRGLGKAGFKHLALGDIDRDGFADMLAVTNDDDLRWYPNNRGGGFYSHRGLGKASFEHLDV